MADELGSGMCNSYKFTRLYSGGEPTFTEDGDLFRIIIPLSAAATVSAGPAKKAVNMNHTVINGAVIKLNKEKVERIINYCVEEKSSAEILELLEMKSKDYFRQYP